MKVQQKTIKNKLHLTLSGSIGLENNEKLKDVLLTVMAKQKDVRIGFKNVENLDLSLIQVLYAYKKQVEGKYKVEFNLPDILKSQIIQFGFKDLLKLQ